MDKKLTTLWVAVALLGLGLLYFVLTGNKVVVVDNQGRQLGAVSSPDFPNPNNTNGLETYVASGSFTDNATTMVSFLSPVPATTTISLVELFNTGVATSTYRIKCGTTYTSGGVPGAQDLIVDTTDIATSTNFGMITSASLNPRGYVVTGRITGTNASTSIALGPGQYFTCAATFYDDTSVHGGAFNNTNEVFDGTYKVRMVR